MFIVRRNSQEFSCLEGFIACKTRLAISQLVCEDAGACLKSMVKSMNKQPAVKQVIVRVAGGL